MVYLYSATNMKHGPINLRFTNSELWLCCRKWAIC